MKNFATSVSLLLLIIAVAGLISFSAQADLDTKLWTIDPSGVCRDDNGKYPRWSQYNWTLSQCETACKGNSNCQGFAMHKVKNYCQLFGSDGANNASSPGTRITRGDSSQPDYTCYLKRVEGSIRNVQQPLDVPEPDKLLYRLMKLSGYDIDRLYTTDKNEAIRSGYTKEGVVGKCFSHQVPGSWPLYRLHSPAATDHLYTTDPIEKDSAMEQGYVYEGVTCYVYTDQKNGTCPLYRLYYDSSPRINHFYTLSKSERDSAIKRTADTGYAYNDEGIAAYIFPYNRETCPQ